MRTCDSSVSSIRAICGALINVFEASRINARSLVEARFDCFDSRFNRCPSCGANSRTNTSGGRIRTSLGRMRPDSTQPSRSLPVSGQTLREGALVAAAAGLGEARFGFPWRTKIDHHAPGKPRSDSTAAEELVVERVEPSNKAVKPWKVDEWNGGERG